MEWILPYSATRFQGPLICFGNIYLGLDQNPSFNHSLPVKHTWSRNFLAWSISSKWIRLRASANVELQKDVVRLASLLALFIYFFLAALGLRCCTRAFSLVVASGGHSSLRCAGFSLRWLLLLGAQVLGMQASVVVAHGVSSCGLQALERRLSSCGARAQLLCSTWDPPGPGLEPVSPAWAGRFLTTVPPGKSPLLPYCRYSTRIGFPFPPLVQVHLLNSSESQEDSLRFY